MSIVVPFSFFQLDNMRRTAYSKYFQNNIYETDISCAFQVSITWCSFAGILYTFNVWFRLLYLKQLQCVVIK